MPTGQIRLRTLLTIVLAVGILLGVLRRPILGCIDVVLIDGLWPTAGHFFCCPFYSYFWLAGVEEWWPWTTSAVEQSSELECARSRPLAGVYCCWLLWRGGVVGHRLHARQPLLAPLQMGRRASVGSAGNAAELSGPDRQRASIASSTA